MVAWCFSDSSVPYLFGVRKMEHHVTDMIAGKAAEKIWMLEHPPLYTAGTSALITDLIEPSRFPVYKAQRGGQYTYHGPGQRIAYTMLDLNKRGKDIKRFVWCLEEWVIQTLAEFGISGERRNKQVGVWVVRKDKPKTDSGTYPEDKIAAIGIRLRKWISFHGISLNIDPNLEHYSGIIPCGVTDRGITSFADLGLTVSMADVDIALKTCFERVFERL